MPTQEIVNLLAKYGWTGKEVNSVTHAFNRRCKFVFYIEQKGKKYTLYDTSGQKLLTGNKSLPQAVEKLLTQYYYAQPI